MSQQAAPSLHTSEASHSLSRHHFETVPATKSAEISQEGISGQDADVENAALGIKDGAPTEESKSHVQTQKPSVPEFIPLISNTPGEKDGDDKTGGAPEDGVSARAEASQVGDRSGQDKEGSFDKDAKLGDDEARRTETFTGTSIVPGERENEGGNIGAAEGGAGGSGGAPGPSSPQPPQFSGLKPLHPIENSRQKWQLTGGLEEADIEIEEERAQQVAIAPMRLSMTNESEIELSSVSVDPNTGNNDVKMGLRESEAPIIEIENERGFTEPNEIEVGNAETPARYPSSQAVEESEQVGELTPGVGEDSYIRSLHEEPPEKSNLSGADPGKTHNLEKDDGGSVDTNDSGARPEYAFNIEDSRPPWILEAHTQLASSKNHKTPRIVKSYDEEVEVGQEVEETKNVLVSYPEERSREGESCLVIIITTQFN